MNLENNHDSVRRASIVKVRRTTRSPRTNGQYLRSLCRGAVDGLLGKIGFQIMRTRSEASCWMQTAKYRNALIGRIAKPMAHSISLIADEPTARTEAVREWVTEYFDTIQTCPVSQHYGGGGWNAGLQLFCLTRALDPVTIIESGTFKGFSSWIFRQAKPNAEIQCFDIDLSKLEWRDPSSIYHEHDWFDVPVAIEDPTRTLVYFDDHVSQAQRILEASSLGLSAIAFDDNLPVEGLFVDGTPAVPTVDMILDERICDQELIEWYTYGKVQRYLHGGATVADARKKLKTVIKLPDLDLFRRCNTTVVLLHT